MQASLINTNIYENITNYRIALYDDIYKYNKNIVIMLNIYWIMLIYTQLI